MKFLKTAAFACLTAFSMAAFAESKCEISYATSKELTKTIKEKKIVFPDGSTNSFEDVCQSLKKHNATVLMTELHGTNEGRTFSAVNVEIVDKDLHKQGVVLSGILGSLAISAGDENTPYFTAMKALSGLNEYVIADLENSRQKLKRFDPKKAELTFKRPKDCNDLRFTVPSTKLLGGIQNGGLNVDKPDLICDVFYKNHIATKVSDLIYREMPKVYANVFIRSALLEYHDQGIPVYAGAANSQLLEVDMRLNSEMTLEDVEAAMLIKLLNDNLNKMELDTHIKEVQEARQYLSKHSYK